MQQKTYTYPAEDQNLTLAYTEWGDSANPRVLVCIHSLSRQSRDFDFLAQRLQSHYRVICPDVAGRGASDWLHDKLGYNLVNYALHIVHLLQELKIQRVDWVGSSLGGMIGFVVNSIQPGLIQKLVLNDVGPLLPQVALQRIGAYVGLDPRFASPGEALEFFKKNFTPMNIQNETHWQHLLTHSLRPAENGTFRLHYDPGIAEPFKLIADKGDLELWSLWEDVKCPVLVLHGLKSDILTSAIVQKMKNTHQRTESVEYPDIGHLPSLMEDGQITTVEQWLLKS